MAEKYIKIRGKVIAVTDDVYYVYYHMGRQRRTQSEKEGRRRVASYDALDTEDDLGINMLVDENSPSVEDVAITKVMSEKLHRCLAHLPESERAILERIYFFGMTERQAAETLGVHHMTLHNRKVKALRKLKKMMIR